MDMCVGYEWKKSEFLRAGRPTLELVVFRG